MKKEKEKVNFDLYRQVSEGLGSMYVLIPILSIMLLYIYLTLFFNLCDKYYN